MEVVDDVVYKITGRIVKKAAIKVDIGANASAEAPEEEFQEEEGGQVNEFVDAFHLESTAFDKKSYTTYIKEYMKRLKTHLQEKNPSRVDPFMKGAQEFVKKVLANFDDYEFYTGESCDPEAMAVIMGYTEDGSTPYIYLFKDGLTEYKC